LLEGGRIADLDGLIDALRNASPEDALKIEGIVKESRAQQGMRLLRSPSPSQMAKVDKAMGVLGDPEALAEWYAQRYEDVGAGALAVEDEQRNLTKTEAARHALGIAPERALHAQYLRMLRGYKRKHPVRFWLGYVGDPFAEDAVGGVWASRRSEQRLASAAREAHLRGKGPRWASAQAYFRSRAELEDPSGLGFPEKTTAAWMDAYEKGRMDLLPSGAAQDIKDMPPSGYFGGYEQEHGFEDHSVNIHYNKAGSKLEQAQIRVAGSFVMGLAGRLGMAQAALDLLPQH